MLQHPTIIMTTGLSLIFQLDGELKKVAGGQKKSGAAAQFAAGVGKYHRLLWQVFKSRFDSYIQTKNY